MRKIFTILCISFFITQISIVHADYVLPYPSYMPGNTLYRISRIADSVKSYWYWGNIASIKYHLGLSDKYLVEAKTLFEYKQYLLASDALVRSDRQLTQIPDLLQTGQKSGEDMSQQRQIIRDAMNAHIGVIDSLKIQLPKEYIWKPEKAGETVIPIEQLLTSSSDIRREVTEKITEP